MNLQQLEYFVSLAQTEHMTQSAKLLNTSQPNLSYTIHELEKELGIPLFEKRGRNIQLTKHGKLYYKYVRAALDQLNQGYTLLKDSVDLFNGEINFGFIYTMGSEMVPHLTKDFVKENPNVTFHFKQNNTKQLLNQLLDGSLDMAMVSSFQGYDSLSFTPFTFEELVVVVPENDQLTKHKEISLEEISQHELVYFNQESGLRQYLDRLFQERNLKINPVVEVEEDHTILGFVGQGYGIAILPNIPSISSYPVKKLVISDKFDQRNIYLATRKNAYIPPIVEKFKEFCLSYHQK
ncbi:LysR family transcriptional regulator [Streptococcus dentiloxodontae]